VAQRVLEAYFGSCFHYCEFYKPRASECCKAFPCRNPAITMSKTHDFGLNGFLGRGIRVQRSVRHLVLFRSFFEAAVSEYEMLRRSEPNLPDTPAAWRTFAHARAGYYRRFAMKWVLNSQRQNHHVVRYEDLTERPVEVMHKVVQVFDALRSVDEERLRASIDGVAALLVSPSGAAFVPQQGIRSRRHLENFRWFDVGGFAEIERSIADLLTHLGYPVRFMSRIGRQKSGWRMWWKWQRGSGRSPEVFSVPTDHTPHSR
jgi:hypothetical protein